MLRNSLRPRLHLCTLLTVLLCQCFFCLFLFFVIFLVDFFCFQHLSTAATLSVKASGRLGLPLRSQTGAEGAPQLP